jgi:poly-beta-1,6-N-acetyl-D-glucosamine synthase
MQMTNASKPTILVISPVRDEEEFLPGAIECIRLQSLQPVQWIVVDDGSVDKSEEIVRRAMPDMPYLKYLKSADRGFRKPGGGVVETFNVGVNGVEIKDYDYIVKLDVDLMFRKDTFRSIVDEFEHDQKLGIAGPRRYEQVYRGSHYVHSSGPRYFVGGPMKFYKRECYDAIGGLVTRAGWDGVDTIKAQMKGWATKELEMVEIYHLRPTGTASGEGIKRACYKYGDVVYYMGGNFLIFLARATYRAIEAKRPQVFIYMLSGYFISLFRKVERQSKSFRRFYKKLQRESFMDWIKYIINQVVNKKFIQPKNI